MRHFFLYITALMLLASCGKSTAPVSHEAGQQAHLLAMEQKEGFVKAEIQDPWHDGAVLHTYLLVPRDSVMPDNLPEGTVLRTPLRNVLVFSEVHTSLMREIGAYDAIGGICDLNYFTDSMVIADVAAGRIGDCGNSMTPSVEKVIELRPEAILLSPYQNSSYGQIEKLGIPLVECADYLEYTPLGRAEWVKFYGALFGHSEEACALYDGVAERYNALKASSQQSNERPTVITEMVINGIWAVPGGNSYMAHLLRDAGASYPWDDDTSTGSLSLDFNQVLAKAQKADYWFVKWQGIGSLADLQQCYELNKNFEAFKAQRVWACDTETSHFFTRVPFHPDLLLAEFVAVLHPEIMPNAAHLFYHRLPKSNSAK